VRAWVRYAEAEGAGVYRRRRAIRARVAVQTSGLLSERMAELPFAAV